MDKYDIFVSEWIEKDSKSVLKGEHTRGVLATRRGECIGGFHIPPDGKTSLYVEYITGLIAAIAAVDNGKSYGSIPIYVWR